MMQRGWLVGCLIGALAGLIAAFAGDVRAQTITRVADISVGPGSGGASYLTVFNDALYYRANPDPSTPNAELWKYDGNTASLAAEIYPGPEGSSPAHLAVYQNYLYFNASGPTGPARLYRYDGVTASRAPSDGNAQNPQDLIVHNNTLFYSATNFSTVGSELWKYNGTSATAIDLWPGPGSSGPKEFVTYNGHLYFNAVNQELWRLNDPMTWASQVTNIGAGNGGSPEHPVEFRQEIYFSANDRQSGRELWRFDGTTARLAADIAIGDGYTSGNPYELTAYDGTLYFGADDGVNGFELWRFDGTTASMVANINARPQLPDVDPVHHSNPSDFKVFDGTLYFSADDGVHGREIWSYDGTTLKMVADLFPGPIGSEPGGFTEFRGRLYFQANHGVSGGELTELRTGVFAMSPPPARDVIARTGFSEPAPGSGSYRPNPGATEMGFQTTSTTTGANPMAVVATTTTTPTSPILSHRSVDGQTIFDTVDLAAWNDVLAEIELQVRDTTYETGDFVRVYVTDGTTQIDLFNFDTPAELNAVAGDGYLAYSAAIPDAWQSATLVIASLSNSTAGAERYDFDNVLFSGYAGALLVGDVNRDGVVDRLDAVQLTMYFTAEGDAVPSGADLNGDGLVSIADLVVLQAHFGESMPNGSAAVPEPTSIGLLASAVVICLLWRRRTSGQSNRRHSR